MHVLGDLNESEESSTTKTRHREVSYRRKRNEKGEVEESYREKPEKNEARHHESSTTGRTGAGAGAGRGLSKEREADHDEGNYVM